MKKGSFAWSLLQQWLWEDSGRGGEQGITGVTVLSPMCDL